MYKNDNAGACFISFLSAPFLSLSFSLFKLTMVFFIEGALGGLLNPQVTANCWGGVWAHRISHYIGLHFGCPPPSQNQQNSANEMHEPP